MTNPEAPKGSADQPFWKRPFTRRQTLLAYFIAGWLGALVLLAVGNYQLAHRLPTLADIAGYMVTALIVGPVFAVLAASRTPP